MRAWSPYPPFLECDLVNIAVVSTDGGYSGNSVDGNATNGGLEAVQNRLMRVNWRGV
jgi:hypothetical protein